MVPRYIRRVPTRMEKTGKVFPVSELKKVTRKLRKIRGFLEKKMWDYEYCVTGALW